MGGGDLAEIVAENSVFLREVLWNPSRTVLGGNQSFQDATVCSELAACSVLFCRWWWRKVLCYIKDRCVLPCLQLGPKGKNSLSKKPNDLGKKLQPTTSSWDVREHFACCWQLQMLYVPWPTDQKWCWSNLHEEACEGVSWALGHQHSLFISLPDLLYDLEQNSSLLSCVHLVQ